MKFIRLHIHLESSSRALRLRLPIATFRVLHWLKRIVQVGLALLILQIGTIFTYDYLLKAATKQQSQLYHRLKIVNGQLNQLESGVKMSFFQEDLVHMKFGVNPPDKAERELGVGGSINPDSEFVFTVHPVRGLKNDLLGKADQIENQISRSEASFENIREFMEQQFKELRHIPSISPATGRFSSGFGLRTHPVTGEEGKMHFGIDISNNRWTPIYSTADGVVDVVKNSDNFGNYVSVNHGNGYITEYGHMEKPIVKIGQFVQRGSILGYMGRTGRATGVHVHYELHRDDIPINPINFVLSSEYSVE